GDGVARHALAGRGLSHALRKADAIGADVRDDAVADIYHVRSRRGPLEHLAKSLVEVRPAERAALRKKYPGSRDVFLVGNLRAFGRPNAFDIATSKLKAVLG